MEFLGLLKKEHVEIPEVNSKRSGISGRDEKNGCHTTLWTSKGEVLLSLEFPRVNWQIPKFKGFFQKCMSSNPPPLPHPLPYFPPFRSRCLLMLRNQSLEHEIFYFAKIKSILK